jgi:hypothetical protein
MKPIEAVVFGGDEITLRKEENGGCTVTVSVRYGNRALWIETRALLLPAACRSAMEEIATVIATCRDRYKALEVLLAQHGGRADAAVCAAALAEVPVDECD